jgi:hypothetical protein
MRRAASTTLFWFALTFSAQAQNCVVSNSTVTGTIEQNCAVYLVAPPAELRVTSLSSTSRNWVEFQVEVASSFTPGTLLISVKGKNVGAVNVDNVTQGIMSSSNWVNGDVRFVRIQSPFGKYHITIIKTDLTEIPDVEFAFNQ